MDNLEMGKKVGTLKDALYGFPKLTDAVYDPSLDQFEVRVGPQIPIEHLGELRQRMGQLGYGKSEIASGSYWAGCELEHARDGEEVKDRSYNEGDIYIFFERG
jgi:hypothetical protein